MISSKEKLIGMLEEYTRTRDITDISLFQASNFASTLYMSRSVVSQYLNALFYEGELIKISARPTLYYDLRSLESRFGIRFGKTNFISIKEMKDYIAGLRSRLYNFEDVIGASGSLKQVVEQIKTASCYPPRGLPMLLVGTVGSGRSAIRKGAIRWCIAERLIDSRDSVVVIDAENIHESEDVDVLLFGDESNEGLFEKHPRALIWICNSQMMPVKSWSRVLDYFGGGYEGKAPQLPQVKSRVFFEYTGEIKDVEKAEWFRRIPVVAEMPSFCEREVGEREAYVFRSFQRERKKIGRRISVSGSVVRRLSARDYQNGIEGLESDVTLACARALADSDGEVSGPIKVFSSHVPLVVGESFDTEYQEASYDDGPILIDVEKYDPFAHSRETLQFLQRFLDRLELVKEDTDDARDALIGYFEYLARSRRSVHQKTSVGGLADDIVARVFERYGLSEPVGFAEHFVDSVLFFKSNQEAINDWRAGNESQIRECIKIVRGEFCFEDEMVQQISKRLKDHLGWRVSDDNAALLASYLHWCVQEKPLSCKGIIAAHGYSTASSIADAANTLLGSHVYDALDMPLNTSAEEVADRLQEHLLRFPVRFDLVILVDMGSLEQIGEKLSTTLKINVGVINSVSTAMALEAGGLMLDMKPMAEILRTVAQNSACSFSISKNKIPKSCIVFTSENGTVAASRLAELFKRSLPRTIDVEMVPCDYLAFQDSQKSAVISESRVLFIFGANDPQIDGMDFVSLEDIVQMSNGDTILGSLSDYLSPSEISELKKNLIRNFSLDNLMRHLTILEPNSLIEEISTFVENLEDALKITFSNKMIMRLYIHVGYLIERLVTKDVIEYKGSEKFARTHDDFINVMQQSFRSISRRYGVELPVTEINYLFDLVQIDDISKIKSISQKEAE